MSAIKKHRVGTAARKWALENGLQEPLQIGATTETCNGYAVTVTELEGKCRVASLLFTWDEKPTMYEIER